MDCLVVEIAYRDQIPELVASTMALILDVMQIEPDVPATSGHGAAVSVPREHLLAPARRDSHRRPLRHRRVERAEMYGIAGSALCDLRADFNVPPAAELPRPLAVGALLDCDLVRG
jgi:hypothetical protein